MADDPAGYAGEKLTAPATRDPDRTRARILSAARAAFAARGLAGARVDAIAEGSGANKRMLYYYFGDKDGLFVAVLEQIYEELTEAAARLDLDQPPLQALDAYVDFVWGYYRDNRDAIAILNSENLHGARHVAASETVRQLEAPFVARLDALLARGRAAGVFRSDLDAFRLHLSTVALAYFYLSNSASLSVFFNRDLASAAALGGWAAHVRDAVRRIVAA